MHDATMELQQPRPTCGSPQLIGIDDDLNDALYTAAQPLNGRFDEAVPICRGDGLYCALKDQDCNTQMLRGGRRGMLECLPDIDCLPQDEIYVRSADTDVEHPGISGP
jgi:hypothetical protein